MMSQLMKVGIPVFKYKTKIPSNKIINKLVFSNFEELILKLNKIDTINFSSEGKYYIEYLGSESLEVYNKVFKEITE